MKDLLDKINGNVEVKKEIQEKESEEFHVLFKFRGGPTYIQPIQLKKQINLRDEVYHHKLYWIKGKKFARVVQIEVDASLLNSGDVFVLDANEKIFQWTGKKANRMEKGRALDLTKRLRDERMNRLKAEVILETEGNESEEFWKEMGGKKDYKTAEEGGDDEEFEKRSIYDDVLYCVFYGNKDEGEESAADRRGQIQIEKIQREEFLHRSMLKHENSYVIDSGTQIFVWNGSKTTVPIRQEANVFAQQLKSDKRRPEWVEVTVTANGAEPALFKMKFKGLFEEYIDTPQKFFRRMRSHHKIAKVREEKVNIDALHHPEKYANEKEDEVGNEKIIDVKKEDDDGTLTIYHVENKEKFEIGEEEYGTFYSEDCYICHYALRIPGSSTRHIVYFWQGRRASIESKGSSALLSSQLAKQLGRNSYQVRVLQGKEPDHFLSHFEGYFNVRLGKRETKAENKLTKRVVKKRTTLKKRKEMEDEKERRNILMFQIRGEDDKYRVRAIQMKLHCTNLCSNDVILIHNKNDNHIMIWKGKYMRQSFMDFTKKFLNHYYKIEFNEDDTVSSAPNNIKVSVIEEGKEDESFWSIFPGGKTEYAKHEIDHKKLKLMICRRRPVFKVTISDDITQDDLLPRSVCILDAYKEVFLWASHDSSEEERTMAAKTATEYIKQAQDGRPSHCPLYHMESKQETYQFTCYFSGWDHESNDIFIPGQEVKDEESDKKEEVENEDKKGTLGRSTTRRKVRRNVSMAILSVPKEEKEERNINQFNPDGIVWDYDRLKVKPTPEGVDPTHLEAYLSVKEFQEIFKMTMDQFYSLPKWKQLVIKKEVKLF